MFSRFAPPSQNDIRLGIWGSSGTGKTTYLTKLYQVLIEKGWKVQTDRKADKFIKENLAKIADGYFPPRTEPKYGEPLEMYTYTLTHERHSNKKVELKFIDAAGEFYEDIENSDATVAVGDNQFINLVEYLLSCHGIIFLLDPMRSERYGSHYFTLLGNLFLEMQANNEGKPLEQYVAFGITKSDHKDNWKKYQNQDPVKSFLELLSPNGTLPWLGNYFQLDKKTIEQQVYERIFQKPKKNHRCQFFYISAIGMYKDGTIWKSPVEDSESSSSSLHNSNSSPSQPSPGSGIFTSNHGKTAGSDHQTNPNGGMFGGNNNSPYELYPNDDNVQRILPKPSIPFGVVEPIEWLIDGIRAYPPSVFEPGSVPNEKSKTKVE